MRTNRGTLPGDEDEQDKTESNMPGLAQLFIPDLVTVLRSMFGSEGS